MRIHSSVVGCSLPQGRDSSEKLPSLLFCQAAASSSGDARTGSRTKSLSARRLKCECGKELLNLGSSKLESGGNNIVCASLLSFGGS